MVFFALGAYEGAKRMTREHMQLHDIKASGWAEAFVFLEKGNYDELKNVSRIEQYRATWNTSSY